MNSKPLNNAQRVLMAVAETQFVKNTPFYHRVMSSLGEDVVSARETARYFAERVAKASAELGVSHAVPQNQSLEVSITRFLFNFGI